MEKNGSRIWVSDKKKDLLTQKIRCRGQKPPTMIPTDCYALRAPTILPNIRISWCLRPTFMLILGQVTMSFYHWCASTRGVRPFAPGIKN